VGVDFAVDVAPVDAPGTATALVDACGRTEALRFGAGLAGGFGLGLGVDLGVGRGVGLGVGFGVGLGVGVGTGAVTLTRDGETAV
jgi:hypothetical protein